MHKAMPYQCWFVRAQVIEQVLESILQAVCLIIADMLIAKVAPAAVSQE
jgi:hypothetical protein